MLLLQCTGVLSHVLPKLHYMYCAETLVLSVTLFLNKYEYTGSTWDFLSHNGTRKTNAAALRTQSPPNKKGQTTVCPFQTVCQGKFWVAVIQDRIQWNLSVRRKVGNFLNMWAANDFCIFRTCPCADEPLECQRHAYLRRHMHACTFQRSRLGLCQRAMLWFVRTLTSDRVFLQWPSHKGVFQPLRRRAITPASGSRPTTVSHPKGSLRPVSLSVAGH